jgi:hypothetical protein
MKSEKRSPGNDGSPKSFERLRRHAAESPDFLPSGLRGGVSFSTPQSKNQTKGKTECKIRQKP